MNSFYESIAGTNPTGLLDYSSTFNMKGQNNIVVDPSTAAKDNLEKSTNNEVICSAIDHFKNNDKKKFNKEIILIIIFLVILVILYFI